MLPYVPSWAFWSCLACVAMNSKCIVILQSCMRCRGSSSQTAVANRAAAVTQSFQLRPPSASQPAAPIKAPTSGVPATTGPPVAAAMAAGAPAAAPATAAPASTDGRQLSHATARQIADAPSSQRPAQAALQPDSQTGAPYMQGSAGRQQMADEGASTPAQQLAEASHQRTLNLHQNDVYSPLQASAPRQV